MFNARLLLLLIASMFACNAFAVDYYWKLGATPGGNYSSPAAGCEAFRAYRQSQAGANITYTIGDSVFLSETSYRCYLDKKLGTAEYPNNESASITRYGDGCPPDTTYNATTGTCDPVEPPQCQGDPFPFSKSGNGPDDYMSYTVVNGVPTSQHPSQQACFNGCIVSTADQKCNARTTGKYHCQGTAYYTGQPCGSGGTDPQESVSAADSPEPPAPANDTTSTPCTYTMHSDGSQTCTSTNTSDKEGQTDHGSSPGGEGDTPKVNTEPSKETNTIDTKVDTKVNPDGTTTVTKTDTLVTTKCKLVNSCTSTTTTTTTTTNKDANGNVTSVSGSCKGAQCPDKNGNPDGNGDGFGDCVGTDCAIEGGGGDWYTPTTDTFGSVLGGFVDRVKASPVGQAGGNFFTFTASGSCPVWNVDVWVFHVRLDQHCNANIPWSLIRAVVIACAAFVAFRWALL